MLDNLRKRSELLNSQTPEVQKRIIEISKQMGFLDAHETVKIRRYTRELIQSKSVPPIPSEIGYFLDQFFGNFIDSSDYIKLTTDDSFNSVKVVRRLGIDLKFGDNYIGADVQKNGVSLNYSTRSYHIPGFPGKYEDKSDIKSFTSKIPGLPFDNSKLGKMENTDYPNRTHLKKKKKNNINIIDKVVTWWRN